MFIGEAPAKTEIRTGEPFVGASGKLLNAVLGNYGISRDSVTLTNACSCHYPVELFKSIPNAAIEACRPRLVSELRQANARTTVLMGKSAITGVMPPAEARKGVNKLRAGPAKKIDFENLPLEVIPTFHPAACLRNQAQFPLMLSDIGKGVSHSRPTLWYEPELVVVDEHIMPHDVERIIYELTQLNRGQGLVVDIESGILQDKDESYGRDDKFGSVICIGIGPTDPANQDVVYVFTRGALERPGTKNLMKSMLNECGVAAQNGKHDIGSLMNYLNQDKVFSLVSDTLIASYVLNEVGGIHGLDYLGQEYIGAPNWKDAVSQYVTKEEGYAAIPPDVLHLYNARDVHATRLLRGYLENLVEEQGLTQVYKQLLRVSGMLTRVERRGLGFDTQYSDTLAEKLKGELQRLEQTFPENPRAKKPGTPLNPRSPKQITEYFADFDYTHNGNPIQLSSTDADTLKALAEDPRIPEHLQKLCEMILESRRYTKMDSNYVTGLRNKLTAARTVHTTFLIHGTTTGRLSSRGPNLQNIPRSKEIKRQFIPKNPKKQLLQVDFSQAELRTLTWLAKEPGLRELFNDPTRDVFTELCREMFPEFDTWDSVQRKEIRTLIKTFAYGISYGRTAEGIAADPDFHMSVAEASRHMRAFQSKIPNIMEFQAGVIKRIHAGEDLINPFGRHRRFYLITDANRHDVYKEAYAYLPQSTASDICLEAACRLDHDDIEIVNLIHDAILAEVYPDEAEDIARHMDKVMCQVAAEITDGYVDFATDWEIGPNWADLASTSA